MREHFNWSRFTRWLVIFVVALVVTTSAIRLAGHPRAAQDINDVALIVTALCVAVAFGFFYRPSYELKPGLNPSDDFDQGQSYWEVTDENGYVVQRGGLVEADLITGRVVYGTDARGKPPSLRMNHTLTTVIEGNKSKLKS